LKHSWGLAIGDDSKYFLCARGCREPDAESLLWAHEHNRTFKALGHTLSDDGSIQPCLTATLASMWRSFYGNFGKNMRHAPLEHKLRLLNRAVLPIATYRMSRWPYQVQAAKQVDKTQTKMIGSLLGMKVQPGDDPATFAMRRNRAAKNIAAQRGKWSSIWRKQVANWSSHLNRPRNHRSWASQTLHYHGKHWLQEQRVTHSVGQWGSMFAGRTCTRAMPGIVHRRWHDGVDAAREV